jgi:hypothetical protein
MCLLFILTNCHTTFLDANQPIFSYHTKLQTPLFINWTLKSVHIHDIYRTKKTNEKYNPFVFLDACPTH